MQLSQIKTCQNCNQLKDLLADLDDAIYKRANTMWSNRKFNTNIPWDRNAYADLIRYKRIIESRIHNPTYPSACFTNQDIYGRVNVLINK